MDLKALIVVVAQASLVLIIAAAGMKSEWRDLQTALKKPELLWRALVAVNIVVPLAAMVATSILPIDVMVKRGIVVMAVSPLAPLVLGRLLKISAQPSLAIGLYFALTLLAVLIVPATIAMLGPIYGSNAALPVSDVAWLVVTSVLLPLLGGMLIAALLPGQAPALATWAARLGNIMLLPFVAAVLYLAGNALITLAENGTLLACVATVAAGLAAGHWLGGPEPAGKIALAVAAATRHPGIALLAGRNAADDPRSTMTILMFLLVSLVLSTIYQKWATKRLIASKDER